MSARLARSMLQTGSRRAQLAAPRRVVGRRNMASEAHGTTTKSDTPWIIGSALVFGPMFLYLVSPSARKNTHSVHNDKKEFPTFTTHNAHASAAEASDVAQPVLMKDDEGTVENVAESISLSEQSDAPKSNISPDAFEVTKTAAEHESASSVQASTPTAPETTEGDSQKSQDDGPVEQAVEDPPKKQAEN